MNVDFRTLDESYDLKARAGRDQDGGYAPSPTRTVSVAEIEPPLLPAECAGRSGSHYGNWYYTADAGEALSYIPEVCLAEHLERLQGAEKDNDLALLERLISEGPENIYWVNLDDLDSPKAVLKFMSMVSEKTWCDNNCLADLFRAIEIYHRIDAVLEAR